MTTRLNLHCTSCHTELRLIVPEPNLTTNGPTFCPYCSHEGLSLSQDTDKDVWEVYEETFGLPQAILESFYQAWVQAPEGHRLFRTYLAAQIEEYMSK